MLNKKEPSKEPSSESKAKKIVRKSAPLEKTAPSSKLSAENPKVKAPVPKASTKTRVVIKYDIGFSNELFIRGQGAGLSWDKGEKLKNTQADEWVWEPKAAFQECTFKVLINDQSYECGDNHEIKSGAQFTYTPDF